MFAASKPVCNTLSGPGCVRCGPAYKKFLIDSNISMSVLGRAWCNLPKNASYQTTLRINSVQIYCREVCRLDLIMKYCISD